MKKSTHSWPTPHEFNKWYGSSLGQRLLALEQQQLDHLLTNVFGYYAVSLGPLTSLHLNQCAVLNKLEIAPEFGLNPRACMAADFQALPFANQSIDLFVLPHVLEFSKTPNAILAEVSRCLISGGYICILGFNARSLFGLWHWLQGKSKQFPWRGDFSSLSCLRHQLKDLGFVVEECHTFYFRPPFHSSGALKKLRFLEVLGPLLWPQHGASYALIARKQTECLTPIKVFKKVEQPIKEFAAAHRERI